MADVVARPRMRESFANLLETVADASGDAPAIVQGSDTRTWAAFDERAARLAGWFAGAGIVPGERVAVALRNHPAYLEAVFALLKLRAVPVNVNYRYRERELHHVLADAGVVGIVLEDGLAAAVAEVARNLPRLRTFLRVGEGPPPDVPFTATDLEHAVAATPPASRIERGDDEWLLYTGGTTGAPKAVVASHAWLYKVVLGSSYRLLPDDAPQTPAELAATVARLHREGRTLTCVLPTPLMHGTGIYSALGTLITGGTVVLAGARGFDPGHIAELLDVTNATDLVIVGDTFARPLADVLDDAAARGRPYDLSSLARIRSVGATWSAEVKGRLLAHADAELRDTIAASEGGPFAVAVASRGAGAGTTSRFELAPGARVIGPDGTDVAPGSGVVGELAAPAGDEVHYLGDDVATAATYRVVDGRRYTVPGDLARVEADGSLTLIGRRSRVINTGGEKVFAEEVEETLVRHPALADVLVVGVPDERFGTAIAALVALRPGASATVEELRGFVGEHLADYKRPRVLAFHPELRRTASGKADLRWARRTAEAAAAPPPWHETADPTPRRHP